MFTEMGISQKTFYRWKAAHPEFAKAIDEGKDLPNKQVEAATFKAACGYEFEEVTRELPKLDGSALQMIIDGKISFEDIPMVVTKRVTKYFPPNPTLNVFWLINRTDRWRDVRTVEARGDFHVYFDEDLDGPPTE